MAGTTPFVARSNDGQPNLAALRKISEQWRESDDAYTRLCRRMSTTLSLETLIGIFAEELAGLVGYDQLTYRHQIGHQDFVYASGMGGRHRCDYRLQLEGVSYGGLTLTRRRRFAEEELAAIEQMLSVAICPIRNACQFAQVQQAALTDALTQIPNKRALDEALNRECHLGDRHQQACTLILCDLDHFKRINDTYGHVIGDHILKATARELNRATRNSDTVFRFGGEEFAILLPHASEAEARQVAERVRKFIAEILVSCGEQQVAATASAGIATRISGETPDQWVARADEALYRAKAQGRNCTRVAERISD
ncbi:MAG: GGDEF domain-containing protein [Marinobacter sp.]|uniref:GGDEF domain-containing protein n=1 Tax=Marinobacter sp. TaxID=50741 RepID=UPI00299D68E1|nr:GGDEF domain-containing protein [Marinobacter sp.]MDX1634277.1 GGDEF domain-containing protein [Marinobacter sp.]